MNTFRLQSRGMNSVGMEALVDYLSLLHESGDGRIRDHEVDGSKRFFLVETPDV